MTPSPPVEPPANTKAEAAPQAPQAPPPLMSAEEIDEIVRCVGSREFKLSSDGVVRLARTALSTAERAIAMREALEELVATKDMHDEIEAEFGRGSASDHLGYQLRRGEAWALARAALSATPPAPAQQNAPSARLAALEEENARLREALAPFSKLADIKLCGEWRDDESIQQTDIAWHVKFGMLRRARAALAQQGGAR